MSTNNNMEGDLIDLHVCSPVLPRISPTTSTQITEEISDNLLDSELPVLEQKLQTTTKDNKSLSRSNSVDVEDILITIDDDDHDDDSSDSDDDIEEASSNLRVNSFKRCNSEAFLSICPKTPLEKSWSCDNLDVLDVLQSLDDLLNASLLESNRILNIDDDCDGDTSLQVSIVSDDNAQQSIEACLLDLDNYLQAYDSTPATPASGTLKDDSLRRRLRQMEENYSRFLVAGRVNRAYMHTECPSEKAGAPVRRSRSASGGRSATLNSSPRCATVSAGRRHKLPYLNTINNNSIITDQQLQAFERHAHASGDFGTGTVVVEAPPPPSSSSPSPSQSTSTSSSSPPSPPLPTNQYNSSDAPITSTTSDAAVAAATSWLRTSMRRLRHLRMPSDTSSPPLPSTTTASTTTITSPSSTSSTEVVTSSTDVPPIILNNNNTTMTVGNGQLPIVQSVLNGGLETVRPVSAPSRLLPNESQRSRARARNSEPSGRARSSSASSRSRRPRSLSSSVSSLASTVDSSPSCTPAPTPTRNQQESGSGGSRRPCERNRQSDMPDAESPLGQWPHSMSSMMACLGCTLGLFNISRFAILTIHFGANFIFQFFFLSMVFGLPLFTLQLCLGQQLGAGVIDMWRISPLFQGVGVALLISQALIGLYSIVGVSWMFVFFRDSFITRTDKYRWAEPYIYYRNGGQYLPNSTHKLSETIPDYFSGVVLQRHHLPSGESYGTIKFQLAFNLAVVWMIVFVSLSKGLRSYGKVIYVFTLLPVFGTFILCAKILGMMPPEYINIIFPETTWSEFFLNPKSWLAAAQETFLTWGLLGAAIMQIASHNKHKHLLQRDSSLVTVITFTILLLVAFLANTCVQILRSYGYNYLPDSFEQMSSYVFLRSAKDPLPPSLASTPVRYMGHNSFIIGEKVLRPGIDHSKESGYQVLRLATELIPATFAILGSDQVSPFWAVLFYFILILFGIAQQLAIWHSVITGIMAIKAKVLKSWETTITFFSCAGGFILGLPMATEFGIYVVYFMDFTVGGIWWLLLVILLQIVAVFMVRGRPYSGDTVVTALFTQNNHPCILSWAPALLSFTWNVILPVALMVLCITTFKNGNFREMVIWHHAPIAEYWPLWARQLGSMLELLTLLVIPFVAIIQSYRYLNNGPSDILERVQSLYRPPIGEHMTDISVHQTTTSTTLNNSTTPATATVTIEDPPPKYTPPPSYTTATGARIAKFLRQSIRRSVRRLAGVLGESSSNRPSIPTSISNQQQPPPPDYSAVLVEMNQAPSSSSASATTTTTGIVTIATVSTPRRQSTLERLRGITPTPGSPTLTAAEVASILRSSFRRSTIRRTAIVGGNTTNNSAIGIDDGTVSLSAENLVESAAPIGETSLVLEHLNNDDDDDAKCETHNSSVI